MNGKFEKIQGQHWHKDREITLLSCIGKLFNALLNQRLNIYLEVNEILGEEQEGFRNQYSTIDYSLTLHLVIDLLLSRKD